MKRNTIKYLILFALVQCLIGCSSDPGESNGEKEFEAVFNNRYGEFLEMDKFKKTDGQNAEVFGIAKYQMKFQAEVSPKKNCYIARSFFDSYEQGLTGKPILNLQEKEGKPEDILEKGKTIDIEGTIEFEKSEKGWSGKKLDYVFTIGSRKYNGHSSLKTK